MAQAARLEATGGSRLNNTATFGTIRIDRAGVTVRSGDIEAGAAIAVTDHKAEERRAIHDPCQAAEPLFSEAFFVCLEELDGARAMVAAAAAGDAIGPVGGRVIKEGGERHCRRAEWNNRQGSAGRIRR